MNTTITKTFAELREYNLLTADIIRRFPNLANTKFSYAMERFGEKNLKEIFLTYNQAVDKVRIEHALTDKDTDAILYTKEPGPNEREYQYSKQGLLNVIKAERELVTEWDKKTFEVEPFIVKDIPKEIKLLEETTIEKLKGILI